MIKGNEKWETHLKIKEIRDVKIDKFHSVMNLALDFCIK